MAEQSVLQDVLLRLLRAATFGGESPDISGLAGAVWQEAMQQGVFLLAMQNVDALVFPPERRGMLRDAIKTTLCANLRLAEGHVYISGLLERAQIPHVLIKGLASALYYPAPELRQLGDIDFYVDPQNVEKTEAVLINSGFKPEKMSHGVHHVFVKDGCRYELHFSVPGVPEGERGDACRACFEDLTARSSVRDTPFGPLRLPDPFHHGLILLLHTAHHLTYSGIGLRHLCDWAVFVADASKDKAFWVRFTAALGALGIRRLAAALTDISTRYLGCPAPQNTEETDEALSDALLSDLFSGGNLGQKDVSRSRQAYLITSGTESRSKLRRMFSVLTDMIWQKWPISKRIRILVPVGWAYFGLRYLIRAALGKRPGLYIKASLRGAQARTSLYDHLRLYEPEKEEL